MKKKRIIKPFTIEKYSKTQVAPFLCKVCDFSSETIPGLVMHHNRVHGTRSKEKVKKNKSQNSGCDVNFCPGCGINIGAVRMALQLTNS